MGTYRLNWFRLTSSIVAGFLENSYFGWNPVPKSDAELLADLVCILIFTLAWERTP